MVKKRDRKRYFSLIFVPDQDKDPKSISMSYARGHLLLVIGVALVVHVLFGFIAYYQIFRFERSIQNLKVENKDLKAKNMRIEDMAKIFQKIIQMDEKIRRAFGGQLGLAEGSRNSQENPNVSPSLQSALNTITGQGGGPERTNESNYFLFKNDNAPAVPDRLPTLLPVAGYMTTHFKKGGWFIGRSHYGIDIAEERGSSIFAAGSGVVLLADWTPDFGNMIIISHGNGFVTYYGHASKLLVAQGANVKKGQAIALLGSSGISSAPHLHFEIWRNGEPLDPEEFLFSIQKKK